MFAVFLLIIPLWAIAFYLGEIWGVLRSIRDKMKGE